MPTPKEEAEALMNEGLPHTVSKLQNHENLIPAAFVLRANGEVAIHLPYDPNHSTLDHLALLEEGLMETARRGELRAIAVFLDGWPRWTPENRPVVDTAKPASGRAPQARVFYRVRA